MSNGRSFDVQSLNSHVVMTLRPELNDAQWSDIERIGNELVKEVEGRTAPVCLLDLSPLNYMGSAMVAMIVRLWKAVNSRTGRFAVVCPDELVLKVLSLAGLDKVWTITDSREEGLRKLGIKGSGSGISSGGGGGSSLSAGQLEVLILGIAGAVVGVIGLGLTQVPSVNPAVSSAMVLGGSLVGFILGLICVMNPVQSRRLIGVALIVICAACGVTAAMQRNPANRSGGNNPSPVDPGPVKNDNPAPAVDKTKAPVEVKTDPPISRKSATDLDGK